MNEMKVLYAMMGIVIVAISAVATMLVFYLPENLECGPGDGGCVSRASDLREICKPSTSVIKVGNETNYIMLRITIRREGEMCVTEEEVIEDRSSGIGHYDITGYRNRCNLSEEELALYGPHACEGSLFDFIAGDAAGGTGGGGFGGETPASMPPHLFCSLEDNVCKATAVSYITGCVPSEMEATDRILENYGNVYLTVYVKVTQEQPNCSLYYRVINAVNLPPDIPPQVVGMNMTCMIPLEEFPISIVEETSCTGELIEYFELIYH